MEINKISVLKRYDVNGAWTHDIELKLGIAILSPNSMWKVVEIIDLQEMREDMRTLEEENENLTEQNRRLVNRITESLTPKH